MAGCGFRHSANYLNFASNQAWNVDLDNVYYFRLSSFKLLIKLCCKLDEHLQDLISKEFILSSRIEVFDQSFQRKPFSLFSENSGHLRPLLGTNPLQYEFETLSMLNYSLLAFRRHFIRPKRSQYEFIMIFQRLCVQISKSAEAASAPVLMFSFEALTLLISEWNLNGSYSMQSRLSKTS